MRNEREARIDEDLAVLTQKKESKENSTPKYLPLSPSLVEISNLDDPDLMTHVEIETKMQASVRGSLGHVLDNKIREIGIKIKAEGGSIGEVRDRTQAWLSDWKDQHIFVRKEGRKASNRFLEGEKVSARAVERYWNRGLDRFQESVIEANMKELSDPNKPFPIMIQANPNFLVIPEGTSQTLAKFRFHKTMLTVRRDYLVYNREDDSIVILDNKFSYSDDEPAVNDLQVLLYTLFAREDVKDFMTPNSEPKPAFLSANLSKPKKVSFYYRRLERGRNIFHYELANMNNAYSNQTWSRLYEFLDSYQANYEKIQDLQERQRKAFIMPYIPKETVVIEENLVQKNMFGVIYDAKKMEETS